MTANLMDAVSGVVSPDLVQKAAGASGESPEGTRSALLGAIPTLFAGFANSASSPSGAAGIFGLVTRAATKPKEIGGQALLSSVFGQRAESVTDALASSSGVRPSSAGGILALVGPLALGALGKEVMSRGLSAGGLTDLLFSHKKAILDNPNVPKGLAGALGLSSLSELGGTAATVGGPTVSAVDSVRPTVERVERTHERVREDIPHPRRQSRWPIMLLPALLLGVLALWGLSNMFKGRPQVPETNTESPTMRQGPGVQERQAPSPAVTEAPREPLPAAGAPEMATPEAAHPGVGVARGEAQLRHRFDAPDRELEGQHRQPGGVPREPPGCAHPRGGFRRHDRQRDRERDSVGQPSTVGQERAGRPRHRRQPDRDLWDGARTIRSRRTTTPRIGPRIAGLRSRSSTELRLSRRGELSFETPEKRRA